MKKIKIIIVGAGLRGFAYADFALAHKEMYEVVAVAEPVKERREKMQRLHHIPDDKCFHDWKPLLALPKFADLAVISTMDDLHFEPCMEAIEKKYDILLEKPMAPRPKECLEIARAAEKNGVRIVVCHVLRFARFFEKLKELIVSGRVGKIATVVHTEGVGNIHQSHSFVRGNWKNSVESAPMILAKSCHDTDIIQWLVGKKCVKVQSFGSLSYFNRENKPKNSPERCIDGCPYADTCYYNAVELYLKDEDNSWFRTAATMKTNPTNEDVEKALRETEYGKCVYSCSNDVVDHQVVNMEFETGITASFTMSAFNKGGRQIRIMGTKGELYGDMENNYVSLYRFDTKETEKIMISDSVSKQDLTGGHSGGDAGLMEELYQYLTDSYHGFSICEISETCDNHFISFAAEKSRVDGGRVVDVKEYEESFSV